MTDLMTSHLQLVMCVYMFVRVCDRGVCVRFCPRDRVSNVSCDMCHMCECVCAIARVCLCVSVRLCVCVLPCCPSLLSPLGGSRCLHSFVVIVVYIFWWRRVCVCEGDLPSGVTLTSVCLFLSAHLL